MEYAFSPFQNNLRHWEGWWKWYTAYIFFSIFLAEHWMYVLKDFSSTVIPFHPFFNVHFFKNIFFSYFRFQLYLKMSVKKFILTTIWQRICSVLVTRKVELTRVVETLGDLCYVNPKGVVGPFGVSLVLAKAVVKKAIMAFMPKCRTTSAGFEVPYQSSETTPQKMPQLTCILSIPVIIHFFLKKDNYFQILFIQQPKSK